MSAIDRLANYKDNVARLKIALVELGCLDKETIETICLPAKVIDDMPRTCTNKFYSVVENAAIMYSEQQEQARQATIQRCKELSKEIDCVDIALNDLEEKDRIIVNMRYVHKFPWHHVAKIYIDHVGYYASIKTLKRHGKRIIGQMDNIL